MMKFNHEQAFDLLLKGEIIEEIYDDGEHTVIKVNKGSCHIKTDSKIYVGTHEGKLITVNSKIDINEHAQKTLNEILYQVYCYNIMAMSRVLDNNNRSTDYKGVQIKDDDYDL